MIFLLQGEKARHRLVAFLGALSGKLRSRLQAPETGRRVACRFSQGQRPLTRTPFQVLKLPSFLPRSLACVTEIPSRHAI